MPMLNPLINKSLGDRTLRPWSSVRFFQCRSPGGATVRCCCYRVTPRSLW